MKKIILLLLAIPISCFTYSQSDTCLTYTELGLSFPPVEVDSQRFLTNLHLNALGINNIRFAENWSFREPSQGVFNWNGLDGRMIWADTNNIDIFLTIQSIGPAWACSGIQNPNSCVFNDNNDFKLYIDTLLKRYPNQIKKIQFGNEWVETFWYAGSAGDFIDANNILYNSVQTYSPLTTVVLGGFTTMSLRISAGCDGAVDSVRDDSGTVLDQAWFTANCNTPPFLAVKARVDSVLNLALYDMIDLHLYDDVELWDEYFYNFTDTISTPIIVSEFGGPNVNYELNTESYQADRVYQYIKKIDSLQISEAYFFKLIEGGGANPTHSTSGLLDSTNLLEKECYWIVKAFDDCITEVSEHDRAFIEIYPNPSKEEFTVLYDQKFTIKLYALNGLEKFHGKGEFKLTIRNIESGMYVLILINDRGETFQELVVIE